MDDQPTGTLTFMFSDIEESTRLWEEHPRAMEANLARHDEIFATLVRRHQGVIVKFTGDGILATFARAADAVLAAVDAQLELRRAEWAAIGELRVRIGLHAGEAELRNGDYHGAAVNRAARLMGAA